MEVTEAKASIYVLFTRFIARTKNKHNKIRVAAIKSRVPQLKGPIKQKKNSIEKRETYDEFIDRNK